MKFLIVVAACLAVASATVRPSLLAKVKAGGSHDIILELPAVTDQIDNSATLQSLKGKAKVSTMKTMLEGLTGAAQAPYITQLQTLGLEYQRFWASNVILIKNVDLATLAKIDEFVKDSAVVREEVVVQLDHYVVEKNTKITQEEAQWGVAQIRAPEAWTVTNGTGVVVGIIDTGANIKHEALSSNFAGAWEDPYFNTADPTDQNGHGSHALGSIVGTASGVGVAPGAQWVACRGLNHQGAGTERNLILCGEFMVTADPQPQVVSNSWGGGKGDAFYNSVINAWNNAGIIPLFAIGNSGSACRSANSPGDQPALLSVGATDEDDGMATFSSRGQSTRGTLKPELSAPGVDIVSVGEGEDGYDTLSGTSMATPHVAGAIALVLAKNPMFTINEVYSALAKTAVQPALSNADRNCGVEEGSDYPNNAYGYGRIDVAAALGVPRP